MLVLGLVLVLLGVLDIVLILVFVPHPPLPSFAHESSRLLKGRPNVPAAGQMLAGVTKAGIGIGRQTRTGRDRSIAGVERWLNRWKLCFAWP